MKCSGSWVVGICLRDVLQTETIDYFLQNDLVHCGLDKESGRLTDHSTLYLMVSRISP